MVVMQCTQCHGVQCSGAPPQAADQVLSRLLVTLGFIYAMIKGAAFQLWVPRVRMAATLASSGFVHWEHPAREQLQRLRNRVVPPLLTPYSNAQFMRMSAIRLNYILGR